MWRQTLTKAMVGMAHCSLPKKAMRGSPIQLMISLTMPSW